MTKPTPTPQGQPTATPWSVKKWNDGKGHSSLEIMGPDNQALASVQWQMDDSEKANAAHIVKCVNSHEELLECLKWTQGMTTEQGWKTFDAWAKRVIANAEGRASGESR